MYSDSVLTSSLTYKQPFFWLTKLPNLVFQSENAHNDPEGGVEYIEVKHHLQWKVGHNFSPCSEREDLPQDIETDPLWKTTFWL